MTNIIFKDKRRLLSFQEQDNYYKAWGISYKYSSQLMKKIKLNYDLDDIYNLCMMLYKQYINELKFNQLKLKNQNYIQVWETMMNTIRYEKKMKQAIHLLHQTNQQRIN